MEQYDVRYVAIYLRKSRAEEGEKDLEKHELDLTQLAKRNNWRYVIYKEIANSEYIDTRPVFKRLFQEIQDDLYDAVLVVDLDRLGRGEQETILERFKISETLIITPDKIYNLGNESDEDNAEFRAFLAKWEYKTIKRRFKRGKRLGAKLGQWTNGIPPFPYRYVPERKGLVVDEEYREIYGEMKKMFFEGVVFRKIAWYLNNKDIPSPRGAVWHENAVRRTLTDETHIGRIISNKTKGSGHKTKNGVQLSEDIRRKNPLKKLPRSEWTIVENCHEALKTQEEHDKILSFLKARKIIPDVVTKGVYLLSGLVYCSKCGHAILMQKRSNKSGERTVTKGCQYRDPYGIKCYNMGVDTEIIENETIKEMEEYEQQLMEKSLSPDVEANLNHKIKEKNKEVDKVNKGIERIMQMYEDGDYPKDVYQSRMTVRKEQLAVLESDLRALNAQLNQIKQTTNEQRLNQIKTFKELANEVKDIKVINEAMRKIVQRVEYVRETKESMQVKVTFH